MPWMEEREQQACRLAWDGCTSTIQTDDRMFSPTVSEFCGESLERAPLQLVKEPSTSSLVVCINSPHIVVVVIKQHQHFVCCFSTFPAILSATIFFRVDTQIFKLFGHLNFPLVQDLSNFKGGMKGCASITSSILLSAVSESKPT